MELRDTSSNPKASLPVEEKRETFVCPSCRTTSPFATKARVGLQTLDDIFHGNVVVSLVTCPHCGCVSMFDPEFVRHSVPPSA